MNVHNLVEPAYGLVVLWPYQISLFCTAFTLSEAQYIPCNWYNVLNLSLIVTIPQSITVNILIMYDDKDMHMNYTYDKFSVMHFAAAFFCLQSLDTIFQAPGRHPSLWKYHFII